MRQERFMRSRKDVVDQLRQGCERRSRPGPKGQVAVSLRTGRRRVTCNRLL